LVYQNSNTFKPILYTKDPEGYFRKAGGYVINSGLGGFYLNVLPDGKLVYINTDEDVHDENIGSFYTIHIITKDGIEYKKITQQFIPIQYPESYIERIKKINEESAKMLKKRKYYSSVYAMYFDGFYAFNYFYIRKGTEVSIVDVFDLKKGKYIKTVIFPEVFAYIKNGYAYSRAYDKDGFREIRKYKINPSVYGK